jgi:hypothetical protein
MRPENNIMLGAAIYAGALKKHRGNEEKALQAYLGGNSVKYVQFILNRAKGMERDKKLFAGLHRMTDPAAKSDEKSIPMNHSDIFI